jgi:EmrB/QacA subfamily drug resistance transporter
MSLITEQNRKWWALGALSFSLFMITLDNTVVTVALKSIQKDLNTTISELEWVVSAYVLTYAVLLIPGGKLADFLGRRRIFVAGLVIFTGSSLWCALSTSGGELIAARAVQGTGAALMLPATLSIISAIFPAETRGAAIGIWAGVSGAALAIGPLVGGILVDVASWPWIFWVNVPVGVAGIVFTLRVVPESRDTSAEQRLDLFGLVTSGAAVFLVTYGLIESNTYGWTSGRILGCFIVGALLLVVFLIGERRQRLPMIDLSLFRNPTFSGGNLAGVATFMSLLGTIFFLSLYFQTVLGYSALKAGATFLCSTIAIMIAAPIGGRLTDRIGARIPVTVGLATWGAALFILSAVLDVHSSFWDFAGLLVLGGLGFGLVLPPSTTAVLGAVPVDKSGVASGMLNAFRQVGGGLGVAIMGAIFASYTGGAAPKGHSNVLPSAKTDPQYGIHFMNAFQWILVFAASVAVAGAIISALTIRKTESISGAVAPIGH